MDELPKFSMGAFRIESCVVDARAMPDRDSVEISVKLRAPDAYKPGEFTDVFRVSVMPLDANAEQIAWMAFESVKDMLAHEVEEFFTVNGKRLNDPHIACGEPYGGSYIVAVDYDKRKVTLANGQKVAYA